VAFPQTPLAAASSWFAGFVGAPLIQQYVVDPLNALATAVNAYFTARQNMSQTAGMSVPDSDITTVYGWAPAEATVNMGTYSAGVRTIAADGFYQVNAQLTYPAVAASTGSRQCRLYVNGVRVVYNAGAPSSTQDSTVAVTWAGTLHVGDQVLVAAYQSQGSAQGLQNAAGANTWQIVRLGPI
jgi:hypothetical protein